MTTDLIKLFWRDLEKLSAELEAYPSEASIWSVSGDIRNSAGTLTLHLLGNLNHFVGKVLGHSDYLRDRDAEFSCRDVPRAELLEHVQNTKTTIERVLSSLNVPSLEEKYPLEVLGYPMTTGYFLLHLLGHLSWHLGQINYHCRLAAQ